MDSEPSFIPKVQFTRRYQAPSVLSSTEFVCRTLTIPVDDSGAIIGAVTDALERLLDPLVWNESAGSVSRFTLAAAVSAMFQAFMDSDCGGVNLADMVKFFILQHQVSGAGPGESVPVGGYVRRNINTEVVDADNVVVLANNQFQLIAGKYLLFCLAPSVGNGSAWLKLKELSGNTYIAQGKSSYTTPSTNTWAELFMIVPLTVLTPTTYEIWQFSQSGYGSGLGFDVGEAPNVFTQVMGIKTA